MSKHNKNITKLNYVEVTEKWFDGAVSNKSKFKERKYFNYKGIRFRVDGRKVKFEYRNNEKEVAQLLQEKFGGTIYALPKVNYPENIRTPDYKYINHRLNFNDYFDLKTIGASGNQSVDNIINISKGQSNNFILYFTSKNMTFDKILNQLTRLYRNPCREWVKTIITIKDGELRVFIRKKRYTHQPIGLKIYHYYL